MLSYTDGGELPSVTSGYVAVQLAEKPAKMTKAQFAQSCLDSIEADAKVWYAAGGSSNVVNIYVSNKSNIKPAIFDMKVWAAGKPPEEHHTFAADIWTYHDGYTIWVYFLQKGVSVFDMAKNTGSTLRNREGFTVQPPPQKITWTPDLEPTVGAYDDEIPF
jgi:hypothetical protein